MCTWVKSHWSQTLVNTLLDPTQLKTWCKLHWSQGRTHFRITKKNAQRKQNQNAHIIGMCGAQMWLLATAWLFSWGYTWSRELPRDVHIVVRTKVNKEPFYFDIWAFLLCLKYCRVLAYLVNKNIHLWHFYELFFCQNDWLKWNCILELVEKKGKEKDQWKAAVNILKK